MSMEKKIGIVKSSISGIHYPIWWNSDEKTVWREQMFGFKEMIGINANEENSALVIATDFLVRQI